MRIYKICEGENWILIFPSYIYSKIVKKGKEMTAKRRVVIKELLAVTPFGIGTDKFWNSLVEGKSGISTSELIDVSKHVVKISGEV